LLKSINLSLSSICGADCIFCPKSAVKKTMPFELVKKIVDEISSAGFREKHEVSNIQIGENGDAFLNKDLIEILRYIKLKLPRVSVGVFTNFQNFTKDKARIILSEQLIGSFCCNIDASNEENYLAAKGLELATVKKNIIDFLEIRKELRNEAGLCIVVLTLATYINAVRYYLGFIPVKLKDRALIRVKDDFRLIKKQWAGHLDPKKDMLAKVTTPFFWAEREKIDCKKLDYKTYQCPKLPRMKEEAFIGPDGTWYACCFDSNMQLALGNVMVDSIDAIYASRARKDLMEKLEKREFQEIGGPCKTVNCCQGGYYDKSALVTFCKSRIFEHPRLYAVLKILKDKIMPIKPGS